MNGAPYGRLTNISIYQNVQDKTQLVKQFKLNQSYLFGKLKLDNVAETKNTATPSKIYSFEYNNSSVASGLYGQDRWGFNNGQSANQNLLQSETVVFDGLTYNIGNANRNTDTVAMKSWMLTAVNWPTGGRSEYVYDAHQYYTGALSTTINNINTYTNGSLSQTATTNFTYPTATNISNGRIIADISKSNYSGVIGQSYVQVKDITSNGVTFYVSNTDVDNPFHLEQSFDFIPGHVYEAKACVFSSVSNTFLTSRIQVLWTVHTGAPVIEKGAGLRIRQIKDYTSPGELARTQYYHYEPGTTLTPYNFINQRYKEVYYKLGYTCRDGCHWSTSPLCRIYNSGSVYPASTVGGAPLRYKTVTKFDSDASSVDNGKTVFEYDVIQDQPIAAGTYSNFIHLILNDWKNGLLLKESHYKKISSTYQLVKTTENQYGELKSNAISSLRIQTPLITSGCYVQNASTVGNDLDFFPVPIPSGSKKLIKSTESTYDAGGNIIKNIVTNQYSSVSNDFVTKSTMADSKGSTKSSTLKYPVDFAATGNVYSKMVTANLLNEVIERKQYKEISGSSTLLSTVKTNYRDWKNDGLVIAPETIQASLYSNALEDKIIYTDYSDRKNPKEVKKAFDKAMSYLYDHNFQYPIAEIANGTQANVAYTIFEADAKGNWRYSGSPVGDMAPPTGKMCYVLGSQISKTGLSTSITYFVSYWKKSGSVTVNGTAGIAGRNANGWTYFEHRIQNPTSGTITVTGSSGVIDELRLYPVDAQMTTYTYDPLIGMTSQCDANNDVIYYEYDELGRLKLIKDHGQRVLIKYCYNYAGQVENCSVPPVTVSLSSINDNGGSGFTATYIDAYTNAQYTFDISGVNNIKKSLGSIPSGKYHLTISKPENTSPRTFGSGCGSMSTDGPSATFHNIVVSPSDCNTITLSNIL